jgi:hypothetical protein
LIDSRVVSRTGTFVFYLGDRYFGTLTALVQGPQAGNYEYTSALTVQILKTLLPRLKPLLFPATPAALTAAAPVAGSATTPPSPAAPAPEPVQPAPPAATPPSRTKHLPDEGSSSQADPPLRLKPDNNSSGFPESLDPNVVMPVPPTPPAVPKVSEPTRPEPAKPPAGGTPVPSGGQ